MKAFGILILFAVAVFFMIMLMREFRIKYFRKNMKLGDHCRAPYHEDMQVGFITKIRGEHVYVELLEEEIIVHKKEILPL